MAKRIRGFRMEGNGRRSVSLHSLVEQDYRNFLLTGSHGERGLRFANRSEQADFEKRARAWGKENGYKRTGAKTKYGVSLYSKSSDVRQPKNGGVSRSGSSSSS